MLHFKPCNVSEFLSVVVGPAFNELILNFSTVMSELKVTSTYNRASDVARMYVCITCVR